MSQRELFRTARADHSNRGRGFEMELAAVHDWYRMQGKADIVQNPSAWAFISDKEYLERLKAIEKGKASPGTLAVTDNGMKLMRVPSDVDFSGGGANFAICFDAKETREMRVPLFHLKTHQIHRLMLSSRCGTIAGFMIKFTKPGRVFFIPARYARDKEDQLLKQTGRKRAKAGTASISIEECEKNGVEIFRHKMNTLWDWLAVLVKEK